MHRLPLIVLLVVLLTGLPAAAQEPPTCPPYEGLVCDGWVTDAAGVIVDDAALETAVGRVIGRYGHQIAMVVVPDTAGQQIDEYAFGLGETWGVGDPQRNDGVVVVVDLGSRQTWVEHGPGLNDVPRDFSVIAGAGDSFFANGDFDTGLLAILGALEEGFEALVAGPPVTSPPVTSPPVTGDGEDGSPLGALVVTLGAVAVGAGVGVAGYRSQRNARIRRRREELVDGELERLAVGATELPLLADYERPPDGASAPASTADVLQVLGDLADRRAGNGALTTAWHLDLVDVVDLDRLQRDTTVPLELAASGERQMLDDAMQAAAREALAVDLADETTFTVRLQELARLVDSLRPHRVAEARQRVTAAVQERLVDTPIGPTALSDDGERFLKAGPAFQPNVPASESRGELDEAYQVAARKTAALEVLYERLPAGTTRPAVAAALADLDAEPEGAVERYERLRDALDEQGTELRRDGLDMPAVAALLLLNHDEFEVDAFTRAYRRNRDGGLTPGEAVEFAIAGLSDRSRIREIKGEAQRLGLPASLTVALLDRRPDGIQVYEALAEELAGHEVSGDTRRTIAAILAISLEPAQAMRRWLEARKALADMGLEGAYADVAAAFGASDPRGPRGFALAYATQRQALARSKIEDADRFAPELAHQGTSGQRDSWTGAPIPARLGTFDPYTFFFFHWVLTQGDQGSVGWEPIYRDQSWSQDRNSWFGGFGGGGFAGGGGGGSSWGGSGWSSGSFGGFGGGGFGGGGGGGSGW